jgi:hypothetical protein
LQPSPCSEVQVTKHQLTKFQSVLFDIFQEKNSQQIPFDEVQAIITEKTNFGEALIMGCIEKMADKNKVMLAKGILYLI